MTDIGNIDHLDTLPLEQRNAEFEEWLDLIKWEWDRVNEEAEELRSYGPSNI